MKNYILLITLILLTLSCTDNTRKEILKLDNIEKSRGTVTSNVKIGALDLKKTNIDFEKIETIKMEAMYAEEQDAMAINSIHQSLMGAEKEAQLLDVNFSMSSEPIENGLFVFGIETETPKELTLQMFDEEGFDMVAHNRFNVISGSNYKALNVNAMENGEYIFRLQDSEGKELTRIVNINK